MVFNWIVQASLIFSGIFEFLGLIGGFGFLIYATMLLYRWQKKKP